MFKLRPVWHILYYDASNLHLLLSTAEKSCVA